MCYRMTEDKKKRENPLEALDNLSPEKWKKGFEQAEQREKAGDAWLKGLIEKGERERA